MKEHFKAFEGVGYSGYYKFYKFSDTLGGKLYTFVCVFEFEFGKEDNCKTTFADVLLENHKFDRVQIAVNANVWN